MSKINSVTTNINTNRETEQQRKCHMSCACRF